MRASLLDAEAALPTCLTVWHYTKLLQWRLVQQHRIGLSMKSSPWSIPHLRQAFGGHAVASHFRMGFTDKRLERQPSAELIMRMLGTADVQEERLARHWHVSATIFLHKGKPQGFSRAVPTFPSRWIPTRSHTLWQMLFTEPGVFHSLAGDDFIFSFLRSKVTNQPY